MDQHFWRWDATAVAAAIRTGKISSREAEATEVIEARHGLPAPIEPAP